MASIRKIPRSPYWIACFTNAEGTRTNRSTKLTDKRKALAVAQQWEDASKKGRAGEMTQAAALRVLEEIVEVSTGDPMRVCSVADHFRNYLASREAMGKAESTVKRYRPIFDGFLKSIGPRRAAASIGSVTGQEIERFRDAELASGKAGTTADYVVKVLRGVFEAARRKGLCLSNPAQAVEMTGALAEEKEPFSDGELRALITAAGDGPWRGMILIGAHTGLRLNDAAKLKWKSINLDSSTLLHTPAKTKLYSRKPTAIFMHAQLLRYLRSLPAEEGKASIFPSLQSKTSGGGAGLSNAFARLMESAGVDKTPGETKEGKGRRFNAKSFHSLRHTLLSRLANANVPLIVSKAIAGHSSDEIHERYIHLDVSSQRAAVEGLADI